MQTAYSLPLQSSNLFEMVNSPRILSKVNHDDISNPEFETPARQTIEIQPTDDIMLQFTLKKPQKTTRFRLPRRTRKRLKTTTTTPTITTPTLPTAPISFSYPHTIFDAFFEKQNLALKVAKYFNFTRLSPELEPFYIWYYNALHDKEAEERRNRLLQFRHSYFPHDQIRHEILDHTIFQVPSKHIEYYVLVNDLAADTKDPTIQTFPKGVTFCKTTAIVELLDDILYGDRSKLKTDDGEKEEDGPNIFYTTRLYENTTTVITTTTPEPEPFYNVPNFNDLYKDEVPWITTTTNYYEGLYEYLENYKQKIPSGEDDRTYFF